MNAQRVLNRISTDDIMWVQQKHYFDAVAREATIRDEGYEEGVHNAKLESARNFLRMGLSKEQVAQGAGLSLAELATLQQ